MKRQIFKLQRSLYTTEPLPQLMLYNRDRTVVAQVDLLPDVLTLFGDKHKIFVRGYVYEGKLHVDEVVGDCSW